MDSKFERTLRGFPLTFITEFFVFVALFLVYRLMAKYFGTNGVGIYSLVRRVVAFFEPVLLLGLNIGIPRYIAMSQDRNQIGNYIKAGELLIISCILIFLLLANSFKYSFAIVFFGGTEYVSLVMPSSILLVGIIFHDFVYSYFRGRLMIKTFNSFRMLNVVIFPIIVIIVTQKLTIELLITLTGIATLITALIYSLYFFKENLTLFNDSQLKSALKDLFFYGAIRVPGSIASIGLVSLGPIIGSHFASVDEVGYFSISQSCLAMSAVAITPIGIILLPIISNLIANKQLDRVAENIKFYIEMLIQVSIFACVQLVIFSDVLIKLWMGNDFLSAVPLTRIALGSMTFYLIYLAMISIVDAAKVKPLNTFNRLIALGVFLILSFILLYPLQLFTPIISLSIAFSVGYVCLGTLTYLSINRLFSRKLRNDFRSLVIALAINIPLGILAILGRNLLVSKLFYLISFEILIASIYLAFLWLLKAQWLRILKTSFITKHRIDSHTS